MSSKPLPKIPAARTNSTDHEVESFLSPIESQSHDQELRLKVPPQRQHIYEKPRTKPRRLKSHRRDGWLLEILSSLLSICCVIAQIIILRIFDGKQLSSWHFRVSPNAVISIVSTASKAALILPVSESISQLKWLYFKKKSRSLADLQVYDNASRGPLGAVKFIWNFRKGPSLASLGCLITIVAIAIDPFTQQILFYKSHPTLNLGAEATITRTQMYNNGGRGGVNQVDAPELPLARDPGLQAAIVAGLLNIATPLQYKCAGNNCTYPAYGTLGMCSQCEDLTSTMTYHCVTNFVTTCTFSLPGNITLTGSGSSDANSGLLHTQANTTVLPVTDNVSTKNHEFPVLDLAMIRFKPTGGFTAAEDWMKTAQAYRCKLNICAKAYYGTTSINGTVSAARVVHATFKATQPEGPIFAFHVENDSWPGNRTVQISYIDYLNILGFLSTLFSLKAKDEGLGGLSVAAALSTSKDVPKTFETIAEGVTNHLRVGRHSKVVEGKAYAPRTFIHVRWPWLALPVSLVALACVFLAAAILVSRVEGQAVWKSSLLPLLLVNVDRKYDEFDGMARTLSDLEKRARAMTSRLSLGSRNEPAWELT